MTHDLPIVKSISPSDALVSKRHRPAGVPLDELRQIHNAFVSAVAPTSIDVFGIDFSSAPRRAKPIVVATGHLNLQRRHLSLSSLEQLDSLTAFETWLGSVKAGVFGFDLPFGLPRELVRSFGWSERYQETINTFARHSREDLRQMFKSFCAARPIGAKFAHRETDRPAGSSPSMKWVNPPVAWMLHAGVPRLLAAGLTMPGQVRADRARIALEVYPGLLARSISKSSYKSDTKAKQTAQRRQVRQQMIKALEEGQIRPGLAVRVSAKQRSELMLDGSGDCLDAVFCLSQAAWGLCRPQADFGLMPGFDSLEGWIVGAGVE